MLFNFHLITQDIDQKTNYWHFLLAFDNQNSKAWQISFTKVNEILISMSHSYIFRQARERQCRTNVEMKNKGRKEMRIFSADSMM